MKIVTSVSGGKTSAYIAANYPSDYLVFALVRTSDKSCEFKDRKIAREVEDRIGKPFIGTLEEDSIIYTMLDLEQFAGKKIDWVSGITFDDVVDKKGGWLPNTLHRYCTTNMKLEPIFYWWAETIGEPCIMNIGYRANEVNRAQRMIEKLNKNGFSEYKATFEKHQSGAHKGKNKWESVEWRKPAFPLVDDGIFKSDIESYWVGKPVRFAHRNNCVGCFHRSAAVLKEMSELEPEKFDWFMNQEGGKNGFWKSTISYKKIKEEYNQKSLFDKGTAGCDSGFCGI